MAPTRRMTEPLDSDILKQFERELTVAEQSPAVVTSKTSPDVDTSPDHSDETTKLSSPKAAKGESEDEAPLQLAAMKPYKAWYTIPLEYQEEAVRPTHPPQIHSQPPWTLNPPPSQAPPQDLPSFLRPGARFRGKQSSVDQNYDVTVTLKAVDMASSTLGGYLEIAHLTDSYPKLTTYFDGEIVDNVRFSFVTAAERAWGTTEKTDAAHWAKFGAFRPYTRHVRGCRGGSGGSSAGGGAVGGAPAPLKPWKERAHIFMRWKERFLIPNHDVSSLPGASYEGFYYICFDQLQGDISGIYYHQNSEKYGHVYIRTHPLFPSCARPIPRGEVTRNLADRSFSVLDSSVLTSSTIHSVSSRASSSDDEATTTRVFLLPCSLLSIIYRSLHTILLLRSGKSRLLLLVLLLLPRLRS